MAGPSPAQRPGGQGPASSEGKSDRPGLGLPLSRDSLDPQETSWTRPAPPSPIRLTGMAASDTRHPPLECWAHACAGLSAGGQVT